MQVPTHTKLKLPKPIVRYCLTLNNTPELIKSKLLLVTRFIPNLYLQSCPPSAARTMLGIPVWCCVAVHMGAMLWSVVLHAVLHSIQPLQPLHSPLQNRVVNLSPVLVGTMHKHPKNSNFFSHSGALLVPIIADKCNNLIADN